MNAVVESSCKLTIIVPTYNEADNVIPLIELIEKEVNETDREIIVVDDDSPDGTAQTVERIIPDHPGLRLIVRRKNKGLVESIVEGIGAAKGDVIVWLDADLTMRPHYLNTFLEHIDQGADVVVGSRYAAGGGIKGSNELGEKTTLVDLWKNIQNSEDSILGITISKVGNYTVRHLLDPRFYDYTSGFYAVRKSVFDVVQIKGRYLDYCIRFLAQLSRNNFAIVEVPVIMMPRERGESKTTSGTFTLLKIMLDCFLVILGLVTRRI